MTPTTYSDLEREGYRIRPARMDDLEEAVEMFNRCARVMTGRPEFTLDRYRTEWQAPGFDLDQDTRILLSPDDQIVGCVEVWTVSDPPVHPWVWARVHPEWEGRGIGTAMIHWGKTRAMEATFNRVPEENRIAMYCGTVGTHEPSKLLLEGLGMSLIRQSYRMRIDFNEPIPSASWPDGLSVRTYNHTEDGEAVFRAQDEAFKDHWGYVETPFDQAYERWLHFNVHQDGFDPSLWFLAMDGEEIAGMSLCKHRAEDEAEIGWVSVLCVRRPWRNKGIGLALLHHSFAVLRDRGKQGVGLGVDAENLTGATRLYERAGMHVDRNFLTYGLELRPGRELSKQTP